MNFSGFIENKWRYKKYLLELINLLEQINQQQAKGNNEKK